MIRSKCDDGEHGAVVLSFCLPLSLSSARYGSAGTVSGATDDERRAR